MKAQHPVLLKAKHRSPVITELTCYPNLEEDKTEAGFPVTQEVKEEPGRKPTFPSLQTLLAIIPP